MEKQGVIAPEITPPENTASAQPSSQPTATKSATDARAQAIEELDGDFRKSAAEATRKSLR